MMLGTADPDRRLCDQHALRPRRGRLHADLRRVRRAQPVARRDHGGGGGDRLVRRRRARPGTYGGALAGVVAGLLAAYATYLLVVRPIQRSRAIPREEKEIFVLTGTLLWGIMIQAAWPISSPTTRRRAPADQRRGELLGVRTPRNEILTAVLSWVAIGLLWLLVNRTRGRQDAAGRLDQPARADAARLRAVAESICWSGRSTACSPASPACCSASFLGVSTDNAGQLTASAFSIVVLGGLGSVSGSLVAAYVVGYLETLTAYLISPTMRPVPALLLLVLVVYVRPQGLLGRR